VESKLNTMKQSGLKFLKKEASTSLTLVLFSKVNTQNCSTIGNTMAKIDSEFGGIFTDAA